MGSKEMKNEKKKAESAEAAQSAFGVCGHL